MGVVATSIVAAEAVVSVDWVSDDLLRSLFLSWFCFWPL